MSKPVYLVESGSFLPGGPVGNDEIEQRLGLILGKPSRVRSRILKQNRIETRHYALDADGRPTHRNSQLAALAVHDALERATLRAMDVEYLAAATTLNDAIVPGFASLVQGDAGIPTCDIASFSGVCASGVAALKAAYAHVRAGLVRNAVVVASELASRHFLASKYEAIASVRETGRVEFDSEFLRWMLSDGAGAVIVSDRPAPGGLSLRVEWIDQRSHADKYETCMYAGLVRSKGGALEGGWADFASFETAGAAGMFTLRQDLELLRHIVPLGVAHYLDLRTRERIPPDFDWFVCHYSSHFFREEIVKLLEQSDATIAPEKWFSNLAQRGNVGSASLFLHLDDLRRSGRLRHGQRILCMVPESARFITSYALLTVEDHSRPESVRPAPAEPIEISSAPVAGEDLRSELIRRLTVAWVDFESSLRTVPLLRKIERGTLTVEDYRLFLVNLRQQVIEGGRWISRAASCVTAEHAEIRSQFIRHARDEHRDYQLLEKDFVSVGGTEADIVHGARNVGSEALSAWMFQCASEPNPFALLGAMFIIEGLGRRVATRWGEAIRRQLGLDKRQVSFLLYHGENDPEHMTRFFEVLSLIPVDRAYVEKTVKTAKVTARLYRLQLEELGNY